MKKLLGEFLGTAILVSIIVGSASMATNLTDNGGVQLMINAFSTFIGLAVLIAIFGSISGAHFNPAVSFIELLQKRQDAATFIQYTIAQIAGGITGAALANAMYGRTLLQTATQTRSGGNQYIGEIVATAGLILVINLLVHHNKQSILPLAVGGWIGSAFSSPAQPHLQTLQLRSVESSPTLQQELLQHAHQNLLQPKF
jgi:glycerol uptake facilitator-like aquaporin